MRKLIASTDVTLDGVIESPEQWSLQFWTDEMQKYAYDQLFASDALLLGRETYEGFAAFWPSQPAEDRFATRMNSLPKLVASTTLQEPLAWNATLLKGSVAEAVSKLKQQPGQQILKC
jgi:dihydrofolate reductase